MKKREPLNGIRLENQTDFSLFENHYLNTRKEQVGVKFKDFAKKSRLKPWDLPILLLLVIASFVPLLVFGVTRPDPVVKNDGTVAKAQRIAILRVDGVEKQRWTLEKGAKSTEYRYEDADGDYNIIEFKDGAARIKEANCGDQICVRQGWIYKDGQTIVCLPHKLVVEIADQTGGADDLIY